MDDMVPEPAILCHQARFLVVTRTQNQPQNFYLQIILQGILGQWRCRIVEVVNQGLVQFERLLEEEGHY